MTLIFSIHYFLWYGALTSIFGYESVYARYYTNASPVQYGYLNMVLPFLTVLVTPVICSLADRQRSHRSYFTLSLVLTTISISFYSMLPLISDHLQQSSSSSPTTTKSQQPSLLLGPWIYYCINSLICDLSTGINTCLSDSFAVLQAEEHGTSFGRIIVWGTFGWASTASILSVINQWSALPRLLPGLLLGSLLLAIDSILISLWPERGDFKLDTIPISAAQTLTGSASSAHKDPNDYQPLNESARINLGFKIDIKSGNRQMRTRSPVLIALSNRARIEREIKGRVKKEFNSDMDGSLKTINSDTNLEHTLPESSQSNNADEMTKQVTPNQKELTIELPTMNPLDKHKSINKMQMERQNSETIQNFIAKVESKQQANYKTKLNPRKATSFRMQLILLFLIMKRRKSLIRYLILFILSGFFMSMHWNYFFLYLDKIYHKKFELISALSMVGQSILGELPFFILSRRVIDFCGRSHTLSISVISIGIRFLLYGYLLPNVSMYYIVLADCFQGPNYGLFYVVMAEIGLEFSFCDEETIERLAARGHLDRADKLQVDSLRLSLRSTVQSVAFACYEGIGVGLGSLAGGWIVASYGFKTLWLSMAICSISVGLINLLIECSCSEHDPELDEDGERQEFMRARRTGALKQVATLSGLPPMRKLDFKSAKKLTQSDKIQLMVRKRAGSRLAPPAFVLSTKQQAVR